MRLNDFMQAKTNEGNEKHVPFIQVAECDECGELSVTLKVGENVFHPSTAEHHIQHIGLHGLTKDNKIVFISRFELGGANTIPYVKIHIRKDVFKAIFAVVLCNLHGMWENSIEL